MTTLATAHSKATQNNPQPTDAVSPLIAKHAPPYENEIWFNKHVKKWPYLTAGGKVATVTAGIAMGALLVSVVTVILCHNIIAVLSLGGSIILLMVCGTCIIDSIYQYLYREGHRVINLVENGKHYAGDTAAPVYQSKYSHRHGCEQLLKCSDHHFWLLVMKPVGQGKHPDVAIRYTLTPVSEEQARDIQIPLTSKRPYQPPKNSH